MADLYGTTDALERMEAMEAKEAERYYTGRPVASDSARWANAQGQLGGLQAGRQIRPRGYDDLVALQTILGALQADISIKALERAVATVKAHLEAEA